MYEIYLIKDNYMVKLFTLRYSMHLIKQSALFIS